MYAETRVNLLKTSDASVEPVSLTEAKSYLRLETTIEDAFVQTCIKAARKFCENHGDRTFIDSVWKLSLGFPENSFWNYKVFRPGDRVGEIRLYRPPAKILTSITSISSAGDPTVIDVSPGSGIKFAPGAPGIISFPGVVAWPTWFGVASTTIEIVYTAGYGILADDVPAEDKMAIMMLMSHFFEHRSVGVEVPDAVYELLRCNRPGSYV